MDDKFKNVLTKKSCSRKALFITEIIEETPNSTARFRHVKYQKLEGDCLKSSTSQVFKVFKRKSYDPDCNTLIDKLQQFSLQTNDSSPDTQTPMECDSSPEGYTTTIDDVEKKHNHTLVKTDTKTVYTSAKRFYFQILFVTLVMLIIIAFAGNYSNDKNLKVQLDSIKRDLKSVVYQRNAINVVLESLETIDSWQKPVHILPFIGHSGVGKTYTANILKRNFIPELVFEINNHHLRNLDYQNEVLNNLHTHYCNLIIIDDLHPDGSYEAIKFISKIPENHIVLVIPIFNIHDENIVVLKKFDIYNLYYKVVMFDTIEFDMLEEWIHQELDKRNIERDRHSQLITKMCDTDQVQHKGFKGVNTKLLLALDDIY